MMEIDFIRVVNQSIKSYRDFPLPAIIVDREFQVYWSNDPAKKFFGHLTDTGGLRSILEEFDLEELRRELVDKGSCTIGDIIPLTGVRLSILPVYATGEMAGMVLLLLGADTILGVRDYYKTAKTASSLSAWMQSTVESVFQVMDVAGMKADIMDAGWIKSSYEKISINCYRILRISQNIAAFSQFQSGHLDVSLKAVDLFSMLKEREDILTLLAQEMGVPIAFKLPGKIASVSLDRENFEAVLLNVLHNALYYTRPGNEIIVRGKKSDEGVTLTVEDKGAGIPAEVLPQVFRPYYAYDRTGAATTLGLGLTLSKILMEAQGGTISVASKEGKGTKVTLTFQNSGFSQAASLAQGLDRYKIADRFSAVYTGLIDAGQSPYREQGV